MPETIAVPMSAADVATMASVYPTAADWATITYDGTNLQVPAALLNTVNGINLVTARTTNLIAYAASKRFVKETSGVTVSGVAIATDRDSQAMLNGAYSMAVNNSAFTTQWKVNATTFVTLTAAQIIAIAVAVGNWVASCFALEATTVGGINAGTITTSAQVDQSFA